MGPARAFSIAVNWGFRAHVVSGRRRRIAMEQRTLGRTGLRVSALGFGCGDVGGLIVRGTPAERERAVARAHEAGINYFDTAASYGNGESEKNLGVTLRALRLRPIRSEEHTSELQSLAYLV